MASFFSIFLALLALSFLIFIHELGHYFMARRVKMRVETFSVGFGRPLFSWMRDGTKWQFGWIPFGGYVRIAGTDTDKNVDPYLVEGGYFSKSPWDRIKVSFMGPFVNLVFALLVFALIWIGGGREKNFSEFTKIIGWVDPKSELFTDGVRPGDEISSFNGVPYHGLHDLLYLGITSSGPVEVGGEKVDYGTEGKSPFRFTVNPYPHPLMKDKSFLTTGVLAPARYLIYQNSGSLENSPMSSSGIQNGDQVFWVDGYQIFSLQQLSYLLNDGRLLLTVERNGKFFLARVPRVEAQELKMTPEVRDELKDWQFAAHLNSVKFSSLYVLPYNLTNDGVVENQVHFIDKEREQEAFSSSPLSSLELPLQPGDRIVAVEGIPVKLSPDILKQVQEKHILMIVKRDLLLNKESWKDADQLFEREANPSEIEKISAAIGTGHPLQQSGPFILLKPILPKTHQEIYSDLLEEQKKQIAAMEDQEKKSRALQDLSLRQHQLELGLPVRDMQVSYNPVPTNLFFSVSADIWRTLKSLVFGELNPKWMSGPVGIVNMFQEQTKLSLMDGFYLLGVISLNLGILNLLPIPMLDGGTIVFSLFEMVTRKKIQPKTMEKLILPFAVLLIVFFIYLTYHDLVRIFGGFWR
jgi:regulator of sigma E protease